MGDMTQLILSQVLIGLTVGVFYAMLSLGLSIIFGLLNIVNFAHGTFYTLGAFVALIGYSFFGSWIGLEGFHIGFWASLIIAPILVGAVGVLLERTMLRRLYKLDHLYSLLLTFGVALVLQGGLSNYFNMSGLPYDGVPQSLKGSLDLGFVTYPKYRIFSIVISLLICFGTWAAFEKTKFGALMRAATENRDLVQSFGVNVPLLVTLTFGFGVGLAGLAGVLAAPIYSVSPMMGSELIITVFAVVVIGGLGSVGGSIIAGISLGIIQGLTSIVYPAASEVVIFIIMAIVLTLKPAGLLGTR